MPFLTVGLLMLVAAAGAAPPAAQPAAPVTAGTFAIAGEPAIATVPITVVHKKTIVPVRFDGRRELRVILDTGMGYDGLLLFKPGLKDSLPGRGFVQAQIAGAGGGPPSSAMFADSLSFRVGEARCENQRVILLSRNFGSDDIDGVIGWSLLGHYAVEIDFDAMTLLLHDPTRFTAGPGWTELPLTLGRKNLPYLGISVAIADEPPIPMKAYIDCASSEAVELLLRPGQKFTMPASATHVVLGQGLSGDIHGKRGRIARLVLGPHELRDVMAAFAPAEVRSKAGDADAVLSNDALRRFNLVYDYARTRLLVRPNGHYREPFE